MSFNTFAWRLNGRNRNFSICTSNFPIVRHQLNIETVSILVRLRIGFIDNYQSIRHIAFYSMYRAACYCWCCHHITSHRSSLTLFIWNSMGSVWSELFSVNLRQSTADSATFKSQWWWERRRERFKDKSWGIWWLYGSPLLNAWQSVNAEHRKKVSNFILNKMTTGIRNIYMLNIKCICARVERHETSKFLSCST